MLAWDFESLVNLRFCRSLFFFLDVSGTTEGGGGMSHSLNWNTVEIYNPACMHALRRDIPTINAELQRSGFSICSSVDFFCDFGQVAGTLCTCVPHLVLGNNKLLPQRENSPIVENSTNILGTKGEWELRAPSISNIAEEWNSIATVECIRESVGLSSVQCPLPS